ncbi:MAG: protoheme IX farnesyltransferase [Acidobacteriaceae bacterium]|nr:protoheme IX farnesyltransferase [Acidobacteriaceae bacterium]
MSDTAPSASFTEIEPLGDWFVLLKPRVVSLVVMTGLIGLLIAPGRIHPFLFFTTIVSIGVGAGAAGAINMCWERDLDGLMRRTRSRPIAAGRVDAAGAMVFGVALAIGSVVVIALATNLVAAAILAVSIVFYVLVYTLWLKRRTPANIVIGGAAGAFPPLIGWTAATGEVGLMPIVLFAIVFLWTPPHFWSLSLYADVDYARAGVPMLPVVAGPRVTKHRILIYTLALVACSFIPCLIGSAGPIYATTAVLLGAGYMIMSGRVWLERAGGDGRRSKRSSSARAAFRFSIYYLALLFGALAVDHIVFTR